MTISTATCFGLPFRMVIVIFLSFTATACNALSFHNDNKCKNNNNVIQHKQQHHAFNRRQAMALVLGTVTMPMTDHLFRTTNSNMDTANAACIPGDTSIDCIGSFKERIPKMIRGQDVQIKQYTLRLNRDDTIITTPDTLDDAIGILSDQRLAMDEMEQLVMSSSGDGLEQAGVLLLAAMPKMIVAGRFAVMAVPNNLTRLMQPILQQMEESTTTLDKTIAMAIRGHAGVMTVAQLAVLKDLSQCKLTLDNLITWAKIGQKQAIMS